MQSVSRVQPLLATLHWLPTALILGALGVGFFAPAPTPNSDPHKTDVLRLHMAGGMPMLLLMTIRLVVRRCTLKPAAAATGHPVLGRLTPLSHQGFYLLILLMVATGHATGILAGLPAIVVAHSGGPLPPSFEVYPTRTAHGYLATARVAPNGVHVLAALYHRYGRRGGLLARTWFGRRRPAAGPHSD
jgi:cytochrome b561